MKYMTLIRRIYYNDHIQGDIQGAGFVTNWAKYFHKKQYKENSTYISISEPEN